MSMYASMYIYAYIVVSKRLTSSKLKSLLPVSVSTGNTGKQRQFIFKFYAKLRTSPLRRWHCGRASRHCASQYSTHPGLDPEGSVSVDSGSGAVPCSGSAVT